jgi:hypothetical protein
MDKTTEMTVKYDTPIQVSFGTYCYLRANFSGCIATRRDSDGNFWIKVWMMAYAKEIEKCL